ncbi:alpha-glucuronidase family glycosyl hydrolase [Radiobacillus sp. PE A8.2]|uniref:alpha-glucuronidase family glycosyl hydrolase n=1 Tax=Radiobacillus sp. PE A8.2 TaxID=3380349 RepID=UPI00388FD754
MESIIYRDNYETTIFATKELKRLMKKAGIDSAIKYCNDDNYYGVAIHLITTETYNSTIHSNEQVDVDKDGFAIKVNGKETWIIGNKHRSILYGIYQYCKIRFGYRWNNLGEELLEEVRVKGVSSLKYEPRFSRRGNIIETIDDVGYINSLIDWGVKNGHNEYFFTFFLWEKIKSEVSPELKKRDFQVTLGGHSLGCLLKKVMGEGLSQATKFHFFSEGTDVQDKVIDKIVDICKSYSVIKRISLWPEDVKIEEKSAECFFGPYMRFMERLKAALSEYDLEVEVEHIVYNAGLAWHMLERGENVTASEKLDILYAYWGRDYSEKLNSPDSNQVKALESLKDWNKQAMSRYKSLTVLEYYSDHFMLTHLFPPLMNRIACDLNDYEDLEIDGVLNLIVPIHKKGQDPELEGVYPWKCIHHLNNYFYTRLAWGDEFETVKEEYFADVEDGNWYLDKITELEHVTAKLTKWNVPLFPARIVDPEKVKLEVPEVQLELREIYTLISSWGLPELEQLIDRFRKDQYGPFTTEEKLLIYFELFKRNSNYYKNLW